MNVYASSPVMRSRGSVAPVIEFALPLFAVVVCPKCYDRVREIGTGSPVEVFNDDLFPVPEYFRASLLGVA